MTRSLNDQDYVFVPKRGVAANINSTATKNAATDGELAYTTDTKQFWLFNGTKFETLNKYSAYIYNSSATASGRLYSNWASLVSAINDDGNPPTDIIFQQAETLPAGAYNLDNVTFVGNGLAWNQGGITITLPTGFTISSWNGMLLKTIRLFSTSANPIMEIGACIAILEQSSITCVNSEFFLHNTTGLFAIGIRSGSDINSVSGGGGPFVPVVNDTFTAYTNLNIVSVEGAPSGTMPDNWIKSTNATIYGILYQTANIEPRQTTNSGIAAGSVDIYALFSRDDAIEHDNTTSGLAAVTVRTAIEELASEKLNLAGGTMAGDLSVPTKTPATASATGVLGTIAWDSDYIYICTATDTWKRTSIATW